MYDSFYQQIFTLFLSKKSYSLKIVILCLFFSSNIFAQTTSNGINTAANFLLITPDARSAAMGNIGMAISPDVNSLSVNASKLAFIPEKIGVGFSYSPWLKNGVSDINLSYLSTFYKLNEQNTLATSFRYFALGKIKITDSNQQDMGEYQPNELSFDFAFSRKLTPDFSLGMAFKYIYSNVNNAPFSTVQQNKSLRNFAVDVSAFYKLPIIFLNKESVFSSGVSILNVGPRFDGMNTLEGAYLPTTLKMGFATLINIDTYNQFSMGLDFQKLLIPSSNKTLNPSVISSIFSSFDNSFVENLKTIRIGTGLEYSFGQELILRSGYYYENPKLGDHRYFTTGLGLKFNVLNADISYLIADKKYSNFTNTFHFSLLFTIDTLDVK